MRASVPIIGGVVEIVGVAMVITVRAMTGQMESVRNVRLKATAMAVKKFLARRERILQLQELPPVTVVDQANTQKSLALPHHQHV